MLDGLTARLRALVARRLTDREIDEELQYHLDRETERNVANGMTPHEARAAAQRSLGNITLAAEDARAALRWSWLEQLRQDAGFALRSFRRAPMFAVTVVLTIGLGLGLLAAAFTFFDAYVLRPLAVRDPYSLYDVAWTSADGASHHFTPDQFTRLRSARGPLVETFASAVVQARVRGRPAMGQFVSGNYFGMLGVSPAIGRTLLPSDDEPGTSGVVVLSHHLWRTVFSGDSSVIGTRINMNGAVLTIVGVAREGFGGLTSSPFDFWIPLATAPSMQGAPSRFRQQADAGLSIVGRIAPKTSVERVRAALAAWMQNETQDRPERERAKAVQLSSRGTAIPVNPESIAMFAPVIIAFLLVLVIACANVANLMLARGMARQREIGIRLALGAGRARLIRQLLTEALLLALPAALLGYVISRLAISTSVSTMLATVPPAYAGYIRLVSLDGDARVFAFMTGAALLSAVAFGLAPALQATRADVVRSSRGDFDTKLPKSRLRDGLVVVQVTVSVILLVTAGVLLSGSHQTDRLDPGVRTHDVVQVELLPKFRERGLAALREDPHVIMLASSATTVLDGAFGRLMVSASGRPAAAAHYNVVSPGWFSLLGMPIERGRGFSDDEAATRAPVAVISRSAAAALWPGQDPLGELVSIPSEDRAFATLVPYRRARVIGVTQDITPGSIALDPRTPVVYYPQPLAADVTQFVARVSGDPTEARNAIERTIAGVDSGAVVEIHSLATSLALQTYPFRAMYWIATAIGAIALVLTIIGVYGVMSYVVAQRQREFGVRLALGASARNLVGLVLRQTLRLSSIGLALGVVCALGVSLIFARAVYNVNPFDLRGYLAGSSVVAVACLVAAYVPSRRAATADPMDALRAE